MQNPSSSIPSLIQEAQEKIDQIRKEIGTVIVGQKEMVDSLLIALFAGGHVLLEGVPGVAKTLAANTLAKIIEADFKRIQFTPDLLPSDLIGTQIYNPKEGTFTIKKGPIFTQILLADEINRAPAKVQSALLEVMQEKQVTISGETYPVKAPFMVLATQNPIEQEGTYPLSEAQTDRFMLKIHIDYPSREEEKTIISRSKKINTALTQLKPILNTQEILKFRELVDSIYVDEKVTDYLLDTILATRHPEAFKLQSIANMLEYGASPRASLALKQCAQARALLAGRYFVTPQDIKDLYLDVLRHRIRPSYEAAAENITVDDLLKHILETIPTP